MVLPPNKKRYMMCSTPKRGKIKIARIKIRSKEIIPHIVVYSYSVMNNRTKTVPFLFVLSGCNDGKNDIKSYGSSQSADTQQ